MPFIPAEIWTNKVVIAVFTYSFLAWSSKGIYDGNVFSAYLFQLVGHRNLEVGIAAGVNGIVMVCLAPVVGWASDNYGRTILLKIGSVFGFMSLGLLAYAIGQNSYEYVIFAQIAGGAFWSSTSGTMDTLLADCTDSGSRSRIYMIRLLLMQTASAVGPVISILLFHYLGNNWQISICRDVMYAGLVCMLFPMALLLVSFPKSFETYVPPKVGTTQAYNPLSDSSSHGLVGQGEGEGEGEVDFGGDIELASSVNQLRQAFDFDTDSESESESGPEDEEKDEEKVRSWESMKGNASINSPTRRKNKDNKDNKDNKSNRDIGLDGVGAGTEVDQISSISSKAMRMGTGIKTSGDKDMNQVTETGADVGLEKDKDKDKDKEQVYLCNGILYVPAMIAISDVITGLASGMTVKFFPIFFLHLLKLQPIQVQIIYLITPLFISVVATYVQKLSKSCGRISVTCGVKTTGCTLLLILSFLASKVEPGGAFNDGSSFDHNTEDSTHTGTDDGETVDAHKPSDHITILIVIVYLLRTAVMNSTKPLTKSVLMDFAPKEQRGRWQSVESVQAATWAGSAVVGGVLIDSYGFPGIFVATSCMQACAMVPLLAISPLVPLEGSE